MGHRGQVDHLHAVGGRLTDDEGVVVEDLDVAPQTLHRRRRDVGQIFGIDWICDVHNRQPIRAAVQHKLPTRLWIHPSPTIVAVGSAAELFK